MMIIAIDQSTSSTKAMLFDEECHLVARCNVDHRQYYPQTGWVEHDAEEIYRNTIEAIRRVTANTQPSSPDAHYSLAITNQRETVVVWNRQTGKPIARAVVWQDTRGRDICQQLTADGHQPLVLQRTGLLIDPNFSASGVQWLLDNMPTPANRPKRGSS